MYSFDTLRRTSRTLILWAKLVSTDVVRNIGVDDSMSFSELHDVLATCFGFEHKGSPWSFLYDDEWVSPEECVHHFLRRTGDSLVYTWGLWEVALQVVEAYPRDNGTPRALCIGGSGAVHGASFEVPDINAELTGVEAIETTLDHTQEDVAMLIRKARLLDYVPLLQALELGRAGHPDPYVVDVCAALPLEDDPAARDSFWVTVLALSCFSDADLSDHIIETTLAEIGWVDDDGSPLLARTARALCGNSLDRLASIGGYGKDSLSPVARLEIYRELLRRKS